MGRDGVPLMPGNDYVPLVANLHFSDITGIPGSGKARCNFPACHQVHGCLLSLSLSLTLSL